MTSDLFNFELFVISSLSLIVLGFKLAKLKSIRKAILYLILICIALSYLIYERLGYLALNRKYHNEISGRLIMYNEVKDNLKLQKYEKVNEGIIDLIKIDQDLINELINKKKKTR